MSQECTQLHRIEGIERSAATSAKMLSQIHTAVVMGNGKESLMVRQAKDEVIQEHHAEEIKLLRVAVEKLTALSHKPTTSGQRWIVDLTKIGGGSTVALAIVLWVLRLFGGTDLTPEDIARIIRVERECVTNFVQGVER